MTGWAAPYLAVRVGVMQCGDNRVVGDHDTLGVSCNDEGDGAIQSVDKEGSNVRLSTDFLF